MAALRTNIQANYAGQVWAALMGIVFLPFYIQILGMEAFGLIGLLLSFQSILRLFDFGVGGNVNRELSRRVHDAGLADGARDLVRTSETVVWLLALAIVVLMWTGSGPIAEHWLHIDELGQGEAQHAIVLMGVAIALLWPSTFYANCLYGLEHQPRLNAITAVFDTLRFAGVLPVLLWISPTIGAFLWWYALVGAGQSLATAWMVWRKLPSGNRPARWSLDELRSMRHFAGGLFGIAILALGVSQLDRLTLASLRPLEVLGYYTLAVSVASGLGRLAQPMFNALYPRFSRLVARREQATMRRLYHLSSQYLVVVIAAVAMVLIVFGYDVLLLWTGDPDLARQVALPLALLAAGSGINGLMNIPYALQLAHGWTRLAMGLNAVSLVLGIPFCVWAVQAHGMAGAALLWLLCNLASFLIGIPLMHRRLLHGEMGQWYLHDILPPLLAAIVTALILRTVAPHMTRSIAGFAWLALVSGTVLAASALASLEVRRTIWRRLRPSL